ncbi:MAG TPA: glycosyl hydrolase [Candidatus Saccharimonadales bacterium]|nr:glycosyl hydrolase [Candidatus Saccharimonadales bacterium]
MKTNIRHLARVKTRVILISSFWRRILIYLLLFQATARGHAQQLTFANPGPSTQLLGGSIGTVKILVLNANGSLATNSSTPIILSVAGPENFWLAHTNNATNGISTFNLSSATLNQPGLYSLAATSSGCVPAFENIGVETTMMPPQGSILAGARVSPSTGPANIAALEAACGRTFALSMHYYAWADSAFSNAQAFTQTQPISDDAASNRIPVVSWNATNLTDILSGANNSAITNAALAMAAFQGPILLRWAWEMNLLGTNSKQWAYLGYPANGSNPSSAQVAAAQTNFVTAWRQIRKVFDANGAANVIWLWNPGAGNDSAPGQSAGGYTDGFYPGDSLVDWIGIDAYNRQDDTFADTYIFDPSYGYTNMAAHGKPLLIGETGAYFTNEAHQITFFDAAAGSLQTNFPQLLGFMYFDANGNDDWSLTVARATNGLTEFSNLVNSAYLNATVPHFLNYAQFHPFSARVHVAPAATTFQGGVIGIGASVDNLYSNSPSGRIDFYSDTNYLATVALFGGSNGYCQVQTFVAVTNAGTHWLRAVYSGDANNSAGQSWPVQVNVLPPPLTFQSIRATNGSVELIWNAVTNQSYQVQFSTNLAKGVWTNLGAVIIATNGTASTTDVTGGTTRFYRIITPP